MGSIKRTKSLPGSSIVGRGISLNHRLVGGSFCWDELRVLTARENIRKQTITLKKKRRGLLVFIPGALYSTIKCGDRGLAEAHFTAVEAVNELNIQVSFKCKS